MRGEVEEEIQVITEHLWLVGFGYRTERGQLVRHFFVVADAADADRARMAALRRAGTPGERAARGGRDIDAGEAEVRRMERDPLGVLFLSAPGPVPLSATVRTAACSPAA